MFIPFIIQSWVIVIIIIVIVATPRYQMTTYTVPCTFACDLLCNLMENNSNFYHYVNSTLSGSTTWQSISVCNKTESTQIIWLIVAIVKCEIYMSYKDTHKCIHPCSALWFVYNVHCYNKCINNGCSREMRLLYFSH